MDDIRKIVDEPMISALDLANYAYELLPLLSRHGYKGMVLPIMERLVDAKNMLSDILVLCPDLQGLKVDPRCGKILERSRSQFEEALEILEDARRRGAFPKYLERPLEELLIKLDMKMPYSTINR